MLIYKLLYKFILIIENILDVNNFLMYKIIFNLVYIIIIFYLFLKLIFI